MKIRELFHKTSEEVIKELFHKLPVGVGCFCISCGDIGLFPFPYNNFDNSLAFERFNNDNELIKNGQKVFEGGAADDLIHLLFLRFWFGKSIPFDLGNEGIDNSVLPGSLLRPNNVTLVSIGIIAKQYPILGYEQKIYRSDDVDKRGFVIYKSVDALQLAINKDKHKNARKNYKEEWINLLKNPVIA